ncbi:hypothetical protein [Streptomyces roseicoloratus]|uniref:hypothetical protein n=1 Tax=Streptomyces roseicoloratus TaxID=2508722 RepID=UPI001009ADEF|nr:hypothetical protein [Streptomyces roseicoloratus]
MGSLRNPVGPLPSSIYWRRRAVALCLVALLALVAVWVLASGGDGGGKANDPANGSSPAPAITPGPSSSGPAFSQRPGGRDESGDEDTAGGDGSGGGTDAGAGTDGTDSGASAGTSAGKNGDTDGAGGDGGAGTGAGQQVPADSPLPNCLAGSLKLTFRSAELAFGPGEKVRFLLTVTNTAAADCKVDLGPKSAVLTVRDTKGVLWSSKDCPRVAPPVYLKVPAHRTITHTVAWDRHRSTAQCASVPPGEVGPGNYLVEATVPGLTVSPVAFRLDKD